MSINTGAARIHAVINGDAAEDEIVISTDQKECVDFAERTLVTQGKVYVRGMQLCQVVRDFTGLSWMKIPIGTPIIMPVKSERLRELVGSAAAWKKHDKRSQCNVDAMVPPWVPATLMQRGQWRLPPLEGVSDTPLLRRDGSILMIPGYDEQSGMLYEPSIAWPAIKVRPTRDDAIAALAELVDPFFDFPFVEECDLSAAVALILSFIGRSAIGRCVPMFVVGATAPGSGKGLIADVCTTIALGHDSPKIAQADDAEMRKRIFTIALEGHAVITLDNIAGVFHSPSLEAALTATVVKDRKLSTNESSAPPMRAVWIMTANNAQLGGDLPRRTIPIDIDPKVENPEDRCDWKHPHLLDHVGANRPRLVSAALTLLSGYFAAGKPPHGKPAKGSFEEWDRLIRGAIIWAGGADPLGGEARVRAGASVEKNDLRALLGGWRAMIGDQSVTASEALRMAGTESSLRDAIDGYAGGKPMDAKTLGMRLHKVRGRVAKVDGDDLCFHEDGTAHGGARLWRIAAPIVVTR